MLKRHARAHVVSQIELAISEATLGFTDVTYGELMAAAANQMRHWAAQLIEIDRYPERFPDLRADYVKAIEAIDNRDPEEDED